MGLLSGRLHKIRVGIVKPYVEGNVLDIGCGPASNLELSKNKIKKYYGIEYDRGYVEKLRKKYPQHKFFQKDLDEDTLDFDIKFDTILLIAVIEHIYNQKHLFREIVKNLKPDGRIIITTPTHFGNDVVHRIGTYMGLFSKKGGQDDHVVIYNRKRFQTLAERFGLKIEKYRSFELACNQLVILRKNRPG